MEVKSGLKQSLSPPGGETKEYTISFFKKKISWIIDSIKKVESVSD